MLKCFEVTHTGGRSFVFDDGTRVQARYFVSLVTFFAHRKQKAKAATAALILSANALLVFAKNSIVRGGGNAERKKRAALSRRTYWNVLRLFTKAFVVQRDEDPLP